MFIHHRYILICIALFTYIIEVRGQVNDAGLWSEIEIEKKINPKLSIFSTEEVRLNENLTEINHISESLGATFKLNKYIRLSMGYQIKFKKRLDNTYITHNKWFTDIILQKKFKSFECILRTRFQEFFTTLESTNSTTILYIRNRFQVEYKVKKIKPFLKIETFHPISNPEHHMVEKVRTGVGLDYRLNRRYSFGFYYLLQKEIFGKPIQNDFIIGTSIKFTM